MTSAESLGEGVKIRRAFESDLPELLDEINLAFARQSGPPYRAEKNLPYLFTPGQMGSYFIAEHSGRILSVVGAYPYDVKLSGVTFSGVGIGQVSTRQEARGTGLMSQLLKRVCESMVEDNVDFSWLWGDRLRYGRYGWEDGGATARFEMFDRYLPPPPDEKLVRTLEFPRDVSLVRSGLETLQTVVIMPDDELELLLGTGKYGVMALNNSFIVHSSSLDTVRFGVGSADEIALLLSHLFRQLRRTCDDRWKITVECPVTESSELMKACYRHYSHTRVDTSARFRVVKLVNFLGKVCRIYQGRLSGGSGELSLTNKDTGESARLVCVDGVLSVQAGAAGKNAYTLDIRELSQVCFGACPLDVLLPGLPADSPFRGILPYKACISSFFAL